MTYKYISGGGTLESHVVQTQDGYCLTLQRLCIPTISSSNTKSPESPGVMKTISEDGLQTETRRPAVLIVHGLMSCGPHWCMNSEDKDLPYRLVNDGYDCWLGNFRGAPLSRNHVKMSPDSSEFWDFSFHEMALHDFPAMVSYILERTGNEKLSYIGHSMGCAVFFASMSLRPEYNSKIKVMIALAPAVYGNHVRNKIARLSIPAGTLLGKLRVIYCRELFPFTLLEIAKKIVISSNIIRPEGLCSWVLSTLGSMVGILGKNQIEQDRMIEIVGHLPSPTSLKAFCHGSQCFSSGIFREYNYGKVGNLKKYGHVNPPLYDLQKTQVPVATIYSESDQICTKKDVTLLAEELPNLIGNFGVNHPHFEHTDFMFGKDAQALVYDTILSIFSKFVKSAS